MASIADFLDYGETQVDRLNELLKPLTNHCGIDNFYHFTTRSNGTMTNVCNLMEPVHLFYHNNFDQEMDYLAPPEQQRSRYILLDHHQPFHKFMDLCEEKCPTHHHFLIIRKESADLAQGFGFASSKRSPQLNSVYLNHLPLLNHFIDHYLEGNAKHQRAANEVAIQIRPAKYAISQGPAELLSPKQGIQILENFGFDSLFLAAAQKLTGREREVMALCMQGKSAREIAGILHLSIRTIEHYVDSSKTKLAVHSKAQLIQCARALDSVNLLRP